MGMASYNKQLLRVAAKKKLWFTILGTVEDKPVWLVRTNMVYDKKKPHVLIAAGFHGEEKAGPLAILRWLESKTLPTKIDVSFLPIINPVGFDRSQRYNSEGQRSNAGFCHPELGDAPSAEGQILLAHEIDLRRLSRNGFLSLHEDVDESKYYMYCYESNGAPSAMAKAIRDVEDRFFERCTIDYDVVTDSSSTLYPERAKIVDGMIVNLCDGSYEDFRMHQGCKHSFATETPGKLRISKRINADTAIMDTFIELSEKEFYGRKNVQRL